jgi:transcriptional regulator with XRE-family HTH domain
MSKSKVKTRGPHPVDRHVGQRIRLRRIMLGLTQKELGKAIRRSSAQIHQFEQGRNQIPADILYALARVLDVPIAFFFKDAPGKQVDIERPSRRRKGKAGRAYVDQIPMMKRETLSLVSAYFRIRDEVLRQKLTGLIETLAELKKLPKKSHKK